MALTGIAEDYFRKMSPLASKIHEDIVEAKMAYENIWHTLTEKEKVEIINESMIKPEITLKYTLLDTLEFDLNNPPVRKDDLMSFFGTEHGQKVVQDDIVCYKDEHSAPFLYQTKSQLNLCALSEHRIYEHVQPSSPPAMTELELSHSKVVSELKNALKSHDILKSTHKESLDRDVVSPTGFLSKFISSFKSKDEEHECLVSSLPQTQVVASSDNFFKTNFKNTQNEIRDRGNRSSMVKSNSDLCEENRGLLSSSHTSSGTDFQSSETLTELTLPKTGYDFLDNW